MRGATPALTADADKTGNDEHQADQAQHAWSGPEGRRIVDDRTVGRAVGLVVDPDRLVFLVTEDETALG